MSILLILSKIIIVIKVLALGKKPKLSFFAHEDLLGGFKQTPFSPIIILAMVNAIFHMRCHHDLLLCVH